MATEYQFYGIHRGSNATIRRAGVPHVSYPALRIKVGAREKLVEIPLTQRDLIQIIRQASALVELERLTEEE